MVVFSFSDWKQIFIFEAFSKSIERKNGTDKQGRFLQVLQWVFIFVEVFLVYRLDTKRIQKWLFMYSSLFYIKISEMQEIQRVLKVINFWKSPACCLGICVGKIAIEPIISKLELKIRGVQYTRKANIVKIWMLTQ